MAYVALEDQLVSYIHDWYAVLDMMVNPGLGERQEEWMDGEICGKKLLAACEKVLPVPEAQKENCARAEANFGTFYGCRRRFDVPDVKYHLVQIRTSS